MPEKAYGIIGSLISIYKGSLYIGYYIEGSYN